MTKLEDITSIDRHKEYAGLVIVDSQPPIKYHKRHIPQAVNLPTSEVFDRGTLELLTFERLTGIFGEAGLDEDRTVLVCDDHVGKNEEMLAWTLEPLGHTRVKLFSTFMGRWTTENRHLSHS